jgi:hypothetical protein
MYAGGIDLATDRLHGNAPSRVPPLDQRCTSGEEGDEGANKRNGLERV